VTDEEGVFGEVVAPKPFQLRQGRGFEPHSI
jgi:hypothetical protein